MRNNDITFLILYYEGTEIYYYKINNNTFFISKLMKSPFIDMSDTTYTFLYSCLVLSKFGIII